MGLKPNFFPKTHLNPKKRTVKIMPRTQKPYQVEPEKQEFVRKLKLG